MKDRSREDLVRAAASSLDDYIRTEAKRRLVERNCEGGVPCRPNLCRELRHKIEGCRLEIWKHYARLN